MMTRDMDMWTCTRIVGLAIGCAAVLAWTPLGAAQSAPAHSATPAPAAVVPKPGITPPADFVIGPDDQLSVVFWRDKDLTADVVVRPDGKISLPLLNEIQAAGLTPEELRQKITEEAKRYVEDPTASVVVKAINSRKVFITGQVEKPGPYHLIAPITVLQLIATAGGLKEYANGGKIIIMRTEKGQPVSYSFNYKDVINRKNMRQNIELRPGDTVIVP
jgi:polysaccharide export outer membrane protein